LHHAQHISPFVAQHLEATYILPHVCPDPAHPQDKAHVHCFYIEARCAWACRLPSTPLPLLANTRQARFHPLELSIACLAFPQSEHISTHTHTQLEPSHHPSIPPSFLSPRRHTTSLLSSTPIMRVLSYAALALAACASQTLAFMPAGPLSVPAASSKRYGGWGGREGGKEGRREGGRGWGERRLEAECRAPGFVLQGWEGRRDGRRDGGREGRKGGGCRRT
jgi:hypothetical protein